jgi:hypothetical protein
MCYLLSNHLINLILLFSRGGEDSAINVENWRCSHHFIL